MQRIFRQVQEIQECRKLLSQLIWHAFTHGAIPINLFQVEALGGELFEGGSSKDSRKNLLEHPKKEEQCQALRRMQLSFQARHISKERAPQ
ncbi:hypothetical protein MRX96_034081 [Rhipicephalus microplus]